MPEDTMTPEPTDGVDIDPTVKSIQDSLQRAFAQAKQLGDAKLATQIGNTLTMLLRDQVLGVQQDVNEDLNGIEYESADFTRGYDEGYFVGYNDGARDVETKNRLS
jgi:hypothetical protein